MRAWRNAAAAVLFAVLLPAGCAQHGGTAPKSTPPASPAASAPAGTDADYERMRQKVDAAESAAAAADQDAASDGNP